MTARQRKANKHIRTIEKKYGKDSGVVVSGKSVESYLKNKGYPSLAKLIRPRKKSASK